MVKQRSAFRWQRFFFGCVVTMMRSILKLEKRKKHFFEPVVLFFMCACIFFSLLQRTELSILPNKLLKTAANEKRENIGIKIFMERKKTSFWYEMRWDSEEMVLFKLKVYTMVNAFVSGVYRTLGIVFVSGLLHVGTNWSSHVGNSSIVLECKWPFGDRFLVYFVVIIST